MNAVAREREKMQHTSWESIETEQLNEKISRKMLSGEHTTVARIFLKRGAIVPRHQHVSEQFTMTISGALKLIFDDHSVVVRAGEMLFIPSGVPHAAEALEDTLEMDVFGPRREDWIKKEDAYLRG